MDVLEWILFLNANADVLYTLVWGDKDLYELGFALAGLLQNYTQVSIMQQKLLSGSADIAGPFPCPSSMVACVCSENVMLTRAVLIYAAWHPS